MKKRHDIKKIKITVLTPLHIGCGESYSPMTFSISRQENMPNYLQEIPAEKMAEVLKDENFKQEFDSIMSERTPDLGKLYGLFQESLSEIDNPAYQVLVSDEIRQHIEKNIIPSKEQPRDNKNGQQNNLLEIVKTYSNHTNHNIIIPGSSLKGSIRTALLNNEVLNSVTHC